MPGSPAQDMERFNKAKKIDKNKSYSFSTPIGTVKFDQTTQGAAAELTIGSKAGTDTIGWIQVVRCGGGTRWYVTEADIKTFSGNKQDFVDRTEGVYGFRVDKTKVENTPVWEQTTIKKG